MKIGTSSMKFDNPVHIIAAASIAGQKEGEGPLGSLFDRVEKDPYFGTDSWEKAESAMQYQAASMAIEKAGLTSKDIRYLFGGDLLGQLIATSFGVAGLGIPFLGLYGACSTMGESLGLAAMTVDAGNADYALAVTSSHFASAEKQFRFPLEYGNQRPYSATWTVTGSGAVVLGRTGGKVRVAGMTPGRVVDMGVKDSMNMGAAMAPAACQTIIQCLKDFNCDAADFDKIITGDLGTVGSRILSDLLQEQGFTLMDRHMDCGMEIFDSEKQDTHAGGSGCGCAAVTLCSLILKNMEEGRWRRVIFAPTGALLSSVSYNEGQSVPGISHAILLEVI